MTTHEHPLPIPELYDDVLSLVAASGSSYTQVAAMNYGGLFGQDWVHQSFDIVGDAKYVRTELLLLITEVNQFLYNRLRKYIKLVSLTLDQTLLGEYFTVTNVFTRHDVLEKLTEVIQAPAYDYQVFNTR
jgi:hypothetical protein